MQKQSRWHAPSLISGALVTTVAMALGALLTGSPGTPRAFAASPEAGDAIPAIELDENTYALIVDRNGIFFLVDRSARAVPVRFDDDTLRNVPGEELLRSR